MFKKFLIACCALCMLAGCNSKKPVEETPVSDVMTFGDYDANYEAKVEFPVMGYGEFVEKVENKETFIAYIGFDECPYCNALKPVLQQIVERYADELPETVYVNVRAEAAEGISNSQETMDAFVELVYGSKDTEFYVPTVIAVKDGEIIANRTGVVDGYNAGEVLSAEQAGKLYDILGKMFEGYVIGDLTHE